MKKQFIIGGVVGLILVATFVYAATLIREDPVISCSDTDGLNYLVKGSTWGLNYTGSYNRTDFCLDGDTVLEFACGVPAEITDPITLQWWSADCSGVNRSTCSQGRCI